MELIDLREEFFLQGGEVGCLIIHGFTGTPGEHIQLGKSLKVEGFTVLGIKLKGHGTTLADMEKSTYNDWVQSAVCGYERLKESCDKVYIIGHSMGALLALYLGENYEVDGIVTLAPPLVTRNKLLRLAGIIKYFKRYRNWDKRKRSIEEAKYLVGYPQYPIKSVHELNKLNSLVKKGLHRIEAPLLIVHSRGDEMVTEEGVKLLYNRVPSKIKKKVYLDKSGHNITIECEKDTVFEAVSSFIRDIV